MQISLYKDPDTQKQFERFLINMKLSEIGETRGEYTRHNSPLGQLFTFRNEQHPRWHAVMKIDARIDLFFGQIVIADSGNSIARFSYEGDVPNDKHYPSSLFRHVRSLPCKDSRQWFCGPSQYDDIKYGLRYVCKISSYNRERPSFSGYQAIYELYSRAQSLDNTRARLDDYHDDGDAIKRTLFHCRFRFFSLIRPQ